MSPYQEIGCFSITNFEICSGSCFPKILDNTFNAFITGCENHNKGFASGDVRKSLQNRLLHDKMPARVFEKYQDDVIFCQTEYDIYRQLKY